MPLAGFEVMPLISALLGLQNLPRNSSYITYVKISLVNTHELLEMKPSPVSDHLKSKSSQFSFNTVLSVEGL